MPFYGRKKIFRPKLRPVNLLFCKAGGKAAGQGSVLSNVSATKTRTRTRTRTTHIILRDLLTPKCAQKKGYSFFDCIRSKTVCDVFHDRKNVKLAENVKKIGQFNANFSPLIMNLNHILKKLTCSGVSKLSNLSLMCVRNKNKNNKAKARPALYVVLRTLITTRGKKSR
jgi:hypothetical protein